MLRFEKKYIFYKWNWYCNSTANHITLIADTTWTWKEVAREGTYCKGRILSISIKQHENMKSCKVTLKNALQQWINLSSRGQFSYCLCVCTCLVFFQFLSSCNIFNMTQNYFSSSPNEILLKWNIKRKLLQHLTHYSIYIYSKIYTGDTNINTKTDSKSSPSQE